MGKNYFLKSIGYSLSWHFVISVLTRSFARYRRFCWLKLALLCLVRNLSESLQGANHPWCGHIRVWVHCLKLNLIIFPSSSSNYAVTIRPSRCLNLLVQLGPDEVLVEIAITQLCFWIRLSPLKRREYNCPCNIPEANRWDYSRIDSNIKLARLLCRSVSCRLLFEWRFECQYEPF